MPYKLVYFPIRGRANAIRYMCVDNDIAFEEENITEEEWPERKSEMIFGQMPVLFDGNTEICQTSAILRHLARKHDLYGKNDSEKVVIDMLNDQQVDHRTAYIRLIYMEYEKEKDNFIKALPEKLALFEKMLLRNNEGSGFFVGDKQSFADYVILDLIDNFTVLDPDCLHSFPLLKEFRARMLSRERLAKFRQSEAFKRLPVNGNGKQ